MPETEIPWLFFLATLLVAAVLFAKVMLGYGAASRVGRTCSACGQGIPRTARFCPRCGKPLDTSN